MLKSLFIAVLALMPLVSVLAATPEPDGSYKACVQYQRKDLSWSKHYKVKGFVVDGNTVNEFARKYSYFSGYEGSSTYFVIPWKKGGYTTLTLEPLTALPIAEHFTTDQRGATWRIKEGWNLCY